MFVNLRRDPSTVPTAHSADGPNQGNSEMDPGNHGKGGKGRKGGGKGGKGGKGRGTGNETNPQGVPKTQTAEQEAKKATWCVIDHERPCLILN